LVPNRGLVITWLDARGLPQEGAKIIGALFGTFLHWKRSLTAQEVKRIGAKTGGRTLFFGGLLFSVAGVLTLLKTGS